MEIEGPEHPDPEAGQGAPDLLIDQPSCRPEGHVLGESRRPIVFYPDGMIVGYCETCSARVSMPWLRGGTSVKRAELVAGGILQSSAAPAHKQVVELQQVLSDLREDEKAVKAAIEYAQLALERVRL